jgi:predicted Rdx family selenoprotein
MQVELESCICRFSLHVQSRAPPSISAIKIFEIEHNNAYIPNPSDLFFLNFLQPISSSQYAQELLSTFSTALGEVSLIPATGGTFTITLLHRSEKTDLSPSKASTLAQLSAGSPSTSNLPDSPYLSPPSITETILWDRKTDGGFPETKELKNRVRNVIEPDRDLGHVDRSLRKVTAAKALQDPPQSPAGSSVEVMSSIEGSLGHGDSGGVATSSSVQGDALVIDADSTTGAQRTEKCEDCQ